MACLLLLFHFLLITLESILSAEIRVSNSFEVIYAAFFVKPKEGSAFAILPALTTIKSILFIENNSCLIYTFPHNIVEYLNSQKNLFGKILTGVELGRIRHESGLSYEETKLYIEMMFLRIDLYAQFLDRHCCTAHIIFTDLDQLFFSSIGKYMNTYSKIKWDMAHIHKAHGNNAGLFLFKQNGIRYGQKILEKVLDIYNSSDIRNRICKHDIPCLRLGGEQIAIDNLLSENDLNWSRNLRNWYLPFLGGIILNLDARVFNAIPGRFEVLPDSKVMHFMGVRKSCMERYFNLFLEGGMDAVVKTEAYNPVLKFSRRKLCKQSSSCRPCKLNTRAESEKQLKIQFEILSKS